MRLIERVRRYVAQHALWTVDTRVVAAVSGGADSVALFCLLQQLAARGDCHLAGLAHLHHHIRGEAADGDAAWCRELAARAGVPAVIGEADVPALARRVALRALETANPSRSYGLDEAQLLCETAAGDVGGSFAGLDMERFGAAVVLVSRKASRAPGVPGSDSFELLLEIPGAVEAPHGRWTVSASGPMPRHEAHAETGQVMVDARTLSPGLIVRPRRSGDRLQPLGAPGRKKVQDVFVDRKIPRDDRDREPIVTDEMGRIVWVAGQVLAAPFRVTPLTTTVVMLTLRRR